MNPADARREQRLHRFFEITLLLKALFAVGEIVSAMGVYVVSTRQQYPILSGRFTHAELAVRPHDIVAAHLAE